MIPLDEARAYVLSLCPPLGHETVPLGRARGAVAARRVVARDPVPPFANTAMDGFALRAADTLGAPRRLRIVGTIAAGDPGEMLVGEGEAARIMTGAPLPPGADAVIMVERTRVEGDEVEVGVEVPEGNHVRPVGDDVTAGQVLIEPGTVLGAGHLGVLATAGAAEVEVVRRPRVGVLSTGDELVSDGAPLRHGQIRDSNRVTLLALAAQDGFEVHDLGLAPDDPDEIERRLLEGAASCDAVISSGGVSMGDFDHVKVVLDRIGDMRWMQVAIKPAKPLAVGTIDSTPIFGLPGNPVSSMVSYELFARSGLRRLAGHPEPVRPTVNALAEADLQRRPDGKTHFVRVVARYDDRGRIRVRPSGGQGSHMLHSMAQANALAVVADGPGVAAGDEVAVLVLDPLA